MNMTKLEFNERVPRRGKLRVAAYVRVSSGKDAALDSLENQAETYAARISASPDWEFVGIYEDCGISGTQEARPEFQRLLSDCRAGKVDMILTKSFTRFARNTVVLLEALRELKKLNIEVVFEKDNIRSLSESGELLITLLAAFAQAESYSASENQRWRIKKMFEEGRPNTGRMMGYRLKDGVLVVVPEEAEIVKMIFADYLSGMGKNAIAKKLNRMHIVTLDGGPWHESSVRSILHNEKYTGGMLLQKTYSPSYLVHKRLVNHGERPLYEVENSHEAIISKEDYEAVKAEMQRRAEKAKPKRPKDKSAQYLFTGIITCGKCGKHYRRKTANAGSKYEKHIWICATFNVWGKSCCDSQQIPEKILIEKTKEVLGTDDLAVAISEMLKGIRVPGAGRLTYIFRDETQKEVVWQNPSRRESWTPEMRQRARDRAMNRKGEK